MAEEQQAQEADNTLGKWIGIGAFIAACYFIPRTDFVLGLFGPNPKLVDVESHFIKTPGWDLDDPRPPGTYAYEVTMVNKGREGMSYFYVFQNEAVMCHEFRRLKHNERVTFTIECPDVHDGMVGYSATSKRL